LSAKAAVGSRPPHTEQGKNQEKPMAMKYALLQHQGLTCFFMVFPLRRLKRAGTDRSRRD
ncbi:MAG: hypothetical protein SPG28_08985, partial [Alloprevotella sp.]|nr:hypothetical protein [Alloprevotella sp.]